jgi:hypothetical protein
MHRDRQDRYAKVVLYFYNIYVVRTDSAMVDKGRKIKRKKNIKTNANDLYYGVAAGRTTMGINLLSPFLLSATISPPPWIFDRFLPTKRESSRYIILSC